MPADIAIVTERRYENPASEDWYSANILHEERLLAEALAQRGLSSKRVDWSRSDVDWSQFTAVVLRSTWDYFDRYEAFCTWLERCSSCTQVINAPELVRWNRDKHYLLDLQQAGVPTVPTVFFEQGMRNRFMNFGLLFETIFGCALIYTPLCNTIFSTRPLHILHWLPGVPFSILIFVYDETRKYLMRKGDAGMGGAFCKWVADATNW